MKCPRSSLLAIVTLAAQFHPAHQFAAMTSLTSHSAGPEAYIVIEAKLDPSHRERFASYASQVPALVAKYGGEYKVMGGTHEPLEGEWGATRIVMHRWPNAESAREFWHSEEYRELKKVREGTGDFRIILLEGLQRKELDE